MRRRHLHVPGAAGDGPLQPARGRAQLRAQHQRGAVPRGRAHRAQRGCQSRHAHPPHDLRPGRRGHCQQRPRAAHPRPAHPPGGAPSLLASLWQPPLLSSLQLCITPSCSQDFKAVQHGAVHKHFSGELATARTGFALVRLKKRGAGEQGTAGLADAAGRGQHNARRVRGARVRRARNRPSRDAGAGADVGVPRAHSRLRDDDSGWPGRRHHRCAIPHKPLQAILPCHAHHGTLCSPCCLCRLEKQMLRVWNTFLHAPAD